jgi:hypothetical protein
MGSVFESGRREPFFHKHTSFDFFQAAMKEISANTLDVYISDNPG